MEKKQLYNWLIIFFLISAIFPIHIFSTVADLGPEWVIDGDTVHTPLDDPYVYAAATPHTLHGRTWVEFDFKSKVYTGPVDFAWGFDVPTVQPTKVEIWDYYTHYYDDVRYNEKWGNKEIIGVISFTNLGIENYTNYYVNVGNSNNTYLYEVFFDVVGDEDDLSGIYAFSSFVANGDNYTLSGNYDAAEPYVREETFWDWNIWNQEFDTINYDYGGMNVWYVLPGANIVEDVDYKIRALIEAPISISSGSGKYWWAFKPSGETINEAINNNHFYCLDPWWDSDWSYYKSIHIPASQVPGNLVNFPIRVNSTDAAMIAKCKANGEDIRFTADDNSTEFYYEIDNWSPGGFDIWVNITSLSSGGTDINMYYGNAGASDAQSASTWDSNYVGVYHMNASTTTTGGCYDSTDNENHGTFVNALPTSAEGKIGGCQDFAGTASDDYLSLPVGCWLSGDDFGTIEAFVDCDGLTNQKKIITQSDASRENRFYLSTQSDEWYTYGKSGNAAQWSYTGTTILANTWYYVCLGMAKDNLDLWHNNSIVTTDTSCTMPVGAASAILIGNANDFQDETYFDGQVDEVRYSSIKRSDDWIITSYNTIINSSTFCQFGSEMTGVPPNNIPTVETPIPTDTSIAIELTPTIGITVADADSDDMNISWWSNSSGSWKVFDTNNAVSDGAETTSNANFSSYETKYWWNVTVEDGMGGEVISSLYSFTTKDNWPPVATNPSPVNQSTKQETNPTLEITMNDFEGEIFNITWESNSSGSWIQFGTSNSVTNGTHDKATSNFSDVNTKYWWRTTAIDDYDYNTTTYWFETAQNFAPEITISSPANESNQQTRPPITEVNIADQEGNTINVSWQSNSSGSWITWGTNLSLNNGTVSDTNSNFSSSNTTYWWRVIATDSTGSNTSAHYRFHTLEGVDKPNSFVATREDATNNIDLSWTKHENATHTKIQMKAGSYPTTSADGTNVYNGTDSLHTVEYLTEISAGINYYFSAWSFTSTYHEFSPVYATTQNKTRPITPTSITITSINNNTLNVTWIKGTAANTTEVRYKTGSYPTGTTDGTQLSNDSTTGQDLTGLTQDTTVFFRAWSWNSSVNLYSNLNVSGFNTTGSQPSNVTNFVIYSYNSTQLNLSWTEGNGTATVIRRGNESYPATPTEGVGVFNSSGSTYKNTGLNISDDYFYSVWGYNGGVFSEGYVYANASTRPQGVQNSSGTLLGGTALNITWNISTGADKYIIRRKANTYPVNISDGTEIYNDTGLTYNDTSYSEGDYYTIWSYNTTTGMIGETVNGTRLIWGGLTVNVFSEKDGSALSSWNITVINENSDPALLEYTGQSNGQSFDIATMPNGADTTIRISCSGYDSRSYYYDIYANEQVTLNAYLSQENQSNLYYFIVLNEYDDPVEDCRVVIKRSVDGSLRNVSIIYTDAAGSGNLHLEANGQYLVSLSKTGYATPGSAEWIADPDYYGAYRDYWKVFRIEHSTGDPTFESFVDFCYFEATMNSTGHINITFWDDDDATTNTAIVVYEHSNYSRTAVAWYNNSNTSYIFQTYNGSSNKEYRVVLHLNHSRLGYRVQWRIVNPQHTPGWDEDDIDKKFEDVFGFFSLGWTKFFVIFLPCLMFLVAFGANHVGISLVGVGGWLVFSSWFINVNSAVTYVAMASLIALLGIVTIISKKGRKVT